MAEEVILETETVASPSRSMKRARLATSPSQQRATPPKRRYALTALIVVLTVGLAVTWSLIAQRELASGVTNARGDQLALAKVGYLAARARAQAALQAHCQILAEDPRLKATLATENMNAETVDDILADLSKLRGGGVFLVLTPEGRVFAESGAKELRGLDLSTSSIVKRAETQATAAVGAWVLGTKAMDLSIMAIRYGDNLIAYLVIGEAISDADLKSLAGQCGCEVATALGGTVESSSTSDASVRDVLQRLAAQPVASSARVVSSAGRDYAARAFELGDVAQSHRLIAVSALAIERAPFERLALVLWIPPLLVLVAVLFALSASRLSRR